MTQYLAALSLKACVNERDVSLRHIFWGATPYWVMLLALAVLVYYLPPIATWLPSIT